jgi:hypothetical protein
LNGDRKAYRGGKRTSVTRRSPPGTGGSGERSSFKTEPGGGGINPATVAALLGDGPNYKGFVPIQESGRILMSISLR